MKNSSSLVGLLVSTVACTNAVSPDAPETNSQAVQAAQPTADIRGTWVFDLDKSDVAAAVREQCKAKADPAACWSEIAAEAKLEKVQFAAGTGGHSQWSSFASDPKEGDILFLSIPVDLSADGPNRVLAKIAGEAKGKHAPQFAKSNIHQLRIDVVDAKTIAMIDPKKGRLVYSKE